MTIPRLAPVVLALLSGAAHADAETPTKHWTAASFELSVEKSTVVPFKKTLEAAQAAAVAWNEGTTGPQVTVSDAESDVREVAFDGVNAVFFETEDWPGVPGQIALTFTHSVGDEIVEADIIINAVDHAWTTKPEAHQDRFDLQNMLTHELGHALGLEHVDTSSATMFTEIFRGEVSKRQLDVVDQQAIQVLYRDIDLIDEKAVGCTSSPLASSPSFYALAGLLFFIRRRRK